MPENYRGKRVSPVKGSILLWAVGGAAVLALAAAAVFFVRAEQPAAGSQAVSSGDPRPPAQSTDASADGSDVSAGDPAASVNEPAAPDVSANSQEAVSYDFSQPAPQREAVDNSYFSDAAFVGDSRTHGFLLYSGIGAGENLTSNGLSIFKLGSKKTLNIGGEDYTLLEALALKEYGKVYLSLGVNELGVYNDDGFYDSYCAAIDAIRAVQPNAVIYIQGLIPLNEKQIKEYNGNKYNLTNDHLRVYNDLMKKTAEEKRVVFLDLYSEFADENGSLPEGVSRDGVHLKKDACRQWLEYLKTHTVGFDELYPGGLPQAPETSMEDGSVQG